LENKIQSSIHQPQIGNPKGKLVRIRSVRRISKPENRVLDELTNFNNIGISDKNNLLATYNNTSNT